MISVIIVNYNVKYFLEQSLLAVRAALQFEPGEVIVFDNASTDGSKAYLTPRFPDVQFIWHEENIGFGRANNKALLNAKGDIILFLNPDTIIGERCLQQSAAYLRSRRDAGGLGVRMVDGRGRFLKESKRAYPSFFTSVFKLCGLSSLFPRSPLFARYYLGHLDSNRSHEVDVLAGAFMMVKKEVLAITGGFDEQFFMYGEDIDLSYRIQEAGYKNLYYANQTIIHFKGESTKRGSLNYIKLFYSAMILFIAKHYTGFSSSRYRSFLYLAIWVRASLAYVGGLVHRLISGGQKVDGLNIDQVTIIGWSDALPHFFSESITIEQRNSVRLSVQQVRAMIAGEVNMQALGDMKKELIISRGELTYEEMICFLTLLPKHVRILFHGEGSTSMVGSDSKDSKGYSFGIKSTQNGNIMPIIKPNSIITEIIPSN